MHKKRMGLQGYLAEGIYAVSVLRNLEYFCALHFPAVDFNDCISVQRAKTVKCRKECLKSSEFLKFSVGIKIPFRCVFSFKLLIFHNYPKHGILTRDAFLLFKAYFSRRE